MFTASGNSALKVDFSQDQRTLKLMGRTIDKVEIQTRPLPTLYYHWHEPQEELSMAGKEGDQTDVSEPVTTIVENVSVEQFRK
jgi:hypothetical protein